MEALGRKEEAQAFRWSCFERTLNDAHLRDYLKRLPEFEDIEAEERAMATALEFPDVHQALGISHFMARAGKGCRARPRPRQGAERRSLRDPVACRGCARRKTSARGHTAVTLDDRFCFETKQGETIPARRPPPCRMCEPRESHR